MEGIHRELFALREAKLALDKAVTPTPDFRSRHHRQTGVAASLARGGDGGAISDVSQHRTPSSSTLGARARNRMRADRSSVTMAATGAAAAAVHTATTAAVSRTGRSSGRRALVEVQLDPDLPLPLPVFPGYRKTPPLQTGGAARKDVVDMRQRSGVFGNPTSVGGRRGDSSAGGAHGYFVPGVLIPRQRQSHSLPLELRAISTTPKPEEFPPSGSATGRRKVRSRPTKSEIGKAPQASPPRLLSENRHASAGLPPESAAALAVARDQALASAREQREGATRAVDELRKEMREREGRLQRELDKLRSVKMNRAAPEGNATAAAVTGSASTTANATGNSTATAPAADAAATATAAAAAAASSTAATRNARPKPAAAKAATVSRLYGARNRQRRDKGRSTRTPGPNPKKNASSTHVPDKRTPDGRLAGIDKGDSSSEALGQASPVEKADAHAQTVTGEVQLFLPPQPAVQDALRSQDRLRRRPFGETPLGSKPVPVRMGRGVRVDNRNRHYDEYYRDGGSGGGGNNGDGGGGDDPSPLSPSSSFFMSTEDSPHPLHAARRVFPPPPVVFLEGEGRNASWRPSDDDRLLRRRGRTDSGGGGGGGVRSEAAGTEEGRPGSCGVPSFGAKAMREVDGGNGGGEGRGDESAKLVIAAPDGEGVEEGEGEVGGEGGGGAAARTLRLTTGRLEPASEVGAESGEWVELGGMLRLSAAATRAAEIADAVEEPPAAVEGDEKPLGGVSASAVSPELLDLMREVVVQQKELSVERSALMQVWYVPPPCRLACSREGVA